MVRQHRLNFCLGDNIKKFYTKLKIDNMMHAPKFKDLRGTIRSAGNPLCCVLFAPLFDTKAANDIISRLQYLNDRTSKRIHVYCVGYGGFWPESEYPDMVRLDTSTYKDGNRTPWAFSQSSFAQFVDDMENHTTWKYSGGSELIILNSNADFSRAIIFKLDRMLKDSVIENIYEIFEALIQTSRKRESAIENFSLSGVGNQAAEVIIDTIKESLPKSLKMVTNFWTRGHHYTLDNISK